MARYNIILKSRSRVKNENVSSVTVTVTNSVSAAHFVDIKPHPSGFQLVLKFTHSFSRQHGAAPLTYISRSTDFVKINVESRNRSTFPCSSDSWEYETLHSNCP